MRKMKFHLVIYLCALLLNCVKNDNKIGKTNPFDQNGDNWHPPTVFAMQDTTVDIYDTVTLHATYKDSNGYVEKYIWALDGVHFSNTSDSLFETAFTSPGIDTVLLKGIDNDGVKSVNIDTVVITVLLKKPTVTAGPKDKIIGIGDSLTITASAYDSNGTIKGYYWAPDGVNFSAISQDSTTKACYNSAGIKYILVKVADDDNIMSETDTVGIIVKDFAPLLYLPVDKSVILGKNVTLQWYSGFFNNHYSVLCGTENPPVTIMQSTTPDTAINISSKLDYDKTYFWCAIGYGNNPGEMDTSAIWQFTTGVPELSKPNIKAKGIDSTSILITWGNLFGADNYFLEYAFTEQGSYTQLYQGTDTTYLHNGLSENQELWYRVSAKNEQFTSEWSDSVSAKASGIPIEGLVAFYPFNGDAKDESGNGNSGTPYGGVSPTKDRFGNEGKAFSFDGVDDYIEIIDNKPLRLDETDFTLSAWIYEKERNESYNSAIMIKRGGGTQDGWAFSISGKESVSGIGKVAYIVSGGFDPYSISFSIVDLNKWYHLLIEYAKNDSTVKIFINSISDTLQKNIPQPNPNTIANLCIGKDSKENVYYFNGKIDDIRIYKRALASEEILQLYHEGGWQGK